MARKKRNRDDENKPLKPPILDGRELEQELLANSDTPFHRTQATVSRALTEANPTRRIQLAEQALAICPDCADA